LIWLKALRSGRWHARWMKQHAAPEPPLCPNCAKPMILDRTWPRVGGLAEMHTFQCEPCNVVFTEGHRRWGHPGARDCAAPGGVPRSTMTADTNRRACLHSDGAASEGLGEPDILARLFLFLLGSTCRNRVGSRELVSHTQGTDHPPSSTHDNRDVSG
jgi:hypothetical protein